MEIYGVDSEALSLIDIRTLYRKTFGKDPAGLTTAGMEQELCECTNRKFLI